MPPELILHVAEGEKCADALIALGWLATTSQGGSGRARESDWAPARRLLEEGGRVIIWPDVDSTDEKSGVNPGLKYAADVAATVTAGTFNECVRVVDLRSAGLGDGQDVFDLIEDLQANGKDVNAIRETLEHVILEHSEPWRPARVDGDRGGGGIGDPRTPGIAPEGKEHRPEISNYRWEIEEDEDGKEVRKRAREPIDAVRESLLRSLNGCLYRLRSPGAREPLLFMPEEESNGVRWIPSAVSLQALAQEYGEVRFARNVDRYGRNFVGWLELYQHLGGSPRVEEYRSVEMYPHEPPMPGSYYAWRSPSAPDDGRIIAAIVSHFDNISAPHHRALFAAAMVTAFWGGAPGKRPAFVFEADLCGCGKSLAAGVVGRACGGAMEVELGQRGSEERLKVRLLSPEGMSKRVLVIDNAKGILDSALIEALITSPEISGHRLNMGEASRPNNLVVLMTANNVRLGPDMARRSFFIKLDYPKYNTNWDDVYSELIGENAERIAVEAVSVLRQPRPEVDLRGTSESLGTWANEVLSRVLACDSIREVVGKISVREVLEANSKRRRESDEKREQAELFFHGLLRELALREGYLRKREAFGEVSLDGDDDRNLYWDHDPEKAPRVTTAELHKWWQKIMGRRVNAAWAGREFQAHIKSGRIQHISIKRDRQGRWYEVAVEAFAAILEPHKANSSQSVTARDSM